MQIETIQFTGARGKQLRAIFWLPDSPAVSVIQITHGMTEHMGRWNTFAEKLTNIGMVVGGFDIRGHGLDVICPEIASFGENDWQATLEDMHYMFLLLKQRFPGLPHHMLGFSLGSFLLREYIGLYPDGIASAVLLGTGQQPAMLLNIMGTLIKAQIRKVGWNETTPLVQKLSFETYNQKFSPNRTIADWLCSDTYQLDMYLQDPMCRKHISSGLFWHLLNGMKRCSAPVSCKNWNKKLSVLLLSGSEDPVGNMGKGVHAVQTQLLKSGIQHVELKLISGARHDLLHEEDSGAANSAITILCQWFSALSLFDTQNQESV